MIRSVTVTNYLGDSIKLELSNPESSGFIIKSIDGLGPGTASINVTEIATNDGSIYNSARVQSRNITITLEYMWQDSIETIRQLSYKYFPLKKKLTLLFETDNRLSEIEGYVESNEPDIFSKNESATISIICPYPFFYEYGKQITIFSGIEPVFEFPFSNESLTDDLLIMGKIENKKDNIITYFGDVETGIIITIHAIGDVGDVSIYNTTTREVITIESAKLESFTGSALKEGDDIIINTNQNQKSVKLLRDGKETNIINCMAKNMDWFKLSKGDNTFVYTATEGELNLQFQIENRIVYEGI